MYSTIFPASLRFPVEALSTQTDRQTHVRIKLHFALLCELIFETKRDKKCNHFINFHFIRRTVDTHSTHTLRRIRVCEWNKLVVSPARCSQLDFELSSKTHMDDWFDIMHITAKKASIPHARRWTTTTAGLIRQTRYNVWTYLLRIASHRIASKIFFVGSGAQLLNIFGRAENRFSASISWKRYISLPAFRFRIPFLAEGGRERERKKELTFTFLCEQWMPGPVDGTTVQR